MKKSTLFALWGGMFILCAGLGFIPEPAGPLKTLLTVLALACFLPPALLLGKARKTGDRNILRLIRNLSGLSLGLTLVLLLGNILAAPGSPVLGGILNSILILVSSPMFCAGSWALSLFLWACLLMASLSLLRRKKA